MEISAPIIDQMNLPTASGLWETFMLRLQAEPTLGWCFVLFWVAILHTFLAPAVRSFAARVEHKRPFLGRILDVFGEVEFVFLLWTVPLFVLLSFSKGFYPTVKYFGTGVSYQEPLFVAVIIALAATRPILYLAERILGFIARIFGGGVAAWWYTLLIIGPLIGSLITEVAAITIVALLLAQKFYEAKPSKKFAYATLGLLFVNISIGGILTHFAAPAVVMVAAKWDFTTPYLFSHFGPAVITSVIVNVLVIGLIFSKELKTLKLPAPSEAAKKPVPVWIVTVHVLLLLWTVINSHYPPLLFFGLLAAIWFQTVSREYQEPLRIFDAVKVGVFLAGLVIFCGLQSWWIVPLFEGLNPYKLFGLATILASFNDNAAVTYLVSLVPNLTEAMKHAALAGAVTGGGLTIIANAPNPAGFSLVRKYFRGEVVNAAGLFLAALIPTLIVAAIFILQSFPLAGG